jgi:hypothetical protein
MNKEITIISSCVGSFVVNKYGISSVEDILLDSFHCDDGLIQVVGKLKDINYIDDKSFAIRLFPENDDEITVNGIKYVKGYEKEKKSFSYSWSDMGIYNPILSNITVIGVGQYKIDIPLKETCEIVGNGYTSFIITNDNNKVSLKIKIKGNSNIVGKHCDEVVKGIKLKIHGFGKIHGFHIINSFVYKVKGLCHINVSKDNNCLTKKKIIGIERLGKD